MSDRKPWRPSRDQLVLAVLFLIGAGSNSFKIMTAAALALLVTAAIDLWLWRPR